MINSMISMDFKSIPNHKLFQIIKNKLVNKTYNIKIKKKEAI